MHWKWQAVSLIISTYKWLCRRKITIKKKLMFNSIYCANNVIPTFTQSSLYTSASIMLSYTSLSCLFLMFPLVRIINIYLNVWELLNLIQLRDSEDQSTALPLYYSGPMHTKLIPTWYSLMSLVPSNRNSWNGTCDRPDATSPKISILSSNSLKYVKYINFNLCLQLIILHNNVNIINVDFLYFWV